MAGEFFNRDIELFIDHRVDWPRYFRLRREDGVHAADEVATYKAILGTLADICEEIAAGARDHWQEEVTLRDGRVIVPPHIASGYEKLRGAGLVCLMLKG